MAAITSATLRTRILQTLGVLAAGETASAEDAALVDGAIDGLFGELTRYGGADFALSSIPDWAQESLRDCVAFRVAPSFGMPPQKLVDLAALFTAGWALLTRQATAAVLADTREKLREKVLQTLGHLRPGELSPAAFTALANDGIDQFFAWYSARGTLGFTATTIPDRAMPFLRDAVAYRTALMSGVRDPQALALLQLNHDRAIAELDGRLTALTFADTKERLRHKVLTHLGVLSAGELPTATQQQVVDDLIAHTLDQLRAHRSVSFTATTIPDWAMTPLRNVIAYEAAPALRVDPSRLALLRADHTEAMMELKRQHVTPTTPDNASPVMVTYY
jgi:hypothetical protein